MTSTLPPPLIPRPRRRAPGWAVSRRAALAGAGGLGALGALTAAGRSPGRGSHAAGQPSPAGSTWWSWARGSRVWSRPARSPAWSRRAGRRGPQAGRRPGAQPPAQKRRRIESGGAFIGPTQTHIAKLAEELRVPTFLEYNTGNSVYVSDGPDGLHRHRPARPDDPPGRRPAADPDRPVGRRDRRRRALGAPAGPGVGLRYARRVDARNAPTPTASRT